MIGKVAHQDHRFGIEVVSDNIQISVFVEVEEFQRAQQARELVGSRTELIVLVGSPDTERNRQVAGTIAAELSARTEFIERVRLHNKEWRAWTRDELVKLGLSVTDGVGNFLLVCFGDEPSRNADAADSS